MAVNPMTRSSPAWLLIGFLIAFVAIGFAHWQLPYDQVSLPDSLYGPGLVAVGLVAMMLRAFGVGRFLTVWLLIASTVPAAVMHGSWSTPRAIRPRTICGRWKYSSPWPLAWPVHWWARQWAACC
jgi:hypothetical protein